MPPEQPLQAFIEQIETILILLERSVVQLQLAALTVATLLAWLLSKALYWLEERYLLPWASGHTHQARLWERWLPALQHLYFPALTILFSLFILLVGGRLVDNIIDLNLLSQIEVIKLFDTSVTLGGTVEKFSIRSTLVRTNDHLNLNIPNEQLLTSVVTTYTKKERAIHLLLPVGASYDSSPKEIRSLLISTANDFELSVWIKPSRHLKRIRSDLYFMIWDSFAEHDIEIPFPQRDLNLRQGWEKISKDEAH